MGSKHECDEALVELQIALHMLKEVLDDDQCQTAIIFDNIGNIFQLKCQALFKKNQYNEALESFRKANAILNAIWVTRIPSQWNLTEKSSLFNVMVIDNEIMQHHGFFYLVALVKK